MIQEIFLYFTIRYMSIMISQTILISLKKNKISTSNNPDSNLGMVHIRQKKTGWIRRETRTRLGQP